MVIIDRIDEFGQRWYDCDLIGVDGTVEQHTLVVIDDDSWELA